MDPTLTELRGQLDQLGIALVEHRDAPEQATVRLVRGRSEQTYALLAGSTIRLTEASSAHADHPLLVFTTTVSPRTADSFRRAKIHYLDLAGNAWLQFGDVFIDVRGRSSGSGASTRGSGNLFSRGGAQVLFALLAWPQLWQGPQRELARTAGVSVGQANLTLRLLTDAGYDKDRAARGPADLLDLWAAAFPTGLAKRIALAEYEGDLSRLTRVEDEDPVLVNTAGLDSAVFASGESAAREMIRPATLTLYVPELDPHLAIKNRWRVGDHANVFIRRKFWNAPDEGDSPLTGLRQAPWPLVYADLASSEDARVRNAAREWRARFA
ncbi:type IV toxin-antitoxin system AbiEi family antitoxin [Tenggerimyces flavus]|uniref:Type IV toxin-antitoxin system AbiEi family antitoxin n=1 Tax=Tenggerimyces flavus TaxID=1708749 RepID=A0ABV7YAP6_9ACTN|nr:type IV toxin-antitoxin system AbiEi family antitoxin [Tenggerimyces flavus]MBM7785178.1 hypothetical protein [Tenggerimyces flavus]